MLSNIEYTKSVLLPRIADLFARYQLPAQNGPLAAVNKALAELDQRVLDAYLEQRSDPLVGTIEPSMYIGNFNWDTAMKPADVRPYVKELLTNLISVHAEVCVLIFQIEYVFMFTLTNMCLTYFVVVHWPYRCTAYPLVWCGESFHSW